jgi:glycosyltransferase involved in cell wall biosynthesis
VGDAFRGPEIGKFQKDDLANMKIIYVTAAIPYGVGETFFLAEIEGLLALGHDIKVVPLRPRGSVIHHDAQFLVPLTAKEGLISIRVALAALMVFASAPVRSLAAAKYCLRSRSLAVALKNLAVLPKALWLAGMAQRDWKAEHIHAQWAGTSASLALMAAVVSGIPWSFTAHQWDIGENNLLAAKVASAQFTRVIDQRGMEEVKFIAGRHIERIILLHVGVKLPALPWAAPSSSEPFRILVPGMFAPKKGHFWMIRALQELADRGIAVKADFAGGGPLEKEIRFQIAKAGIQDKVRLLGWVSHDELMRRVEEREWDVVALSSIEEDNAKEGIPVALMESMARCMPVISTRTGGIPELLEGGAGIMVPAKDSSALADAIEKLAFDLPRRAELAAAGRRRIEESFAIDMIVQKLVGQIATSRR